MDDEAKSVAPERETQVGQALMRLEKLADMLETDVSRLGARLQAVRSTKPQTAGGASAGTKLPEGVPLVQRMDRIATNLIQTRSMVEVIHAELEI
jgi:hypothetical protein